jgi:hypothetical protein
MTDGICELAHDGAPQFPAAAVYVVFPEATFKLTLFNARVALNGMVMTELGITASALAPSTTVPVVVWSDPAKVHIFVDDKP